MTILDRYILRQFFFNFVLLLVVLTMLINTLDLIINLDEFVKAGDFIASQRHWNKALATLWVVFDYYWPQFFFYFVYLAGLLLAGAVGFTLAAMQRNRELLAIIAGGISLYRVALPFLVAGFACSILLMIDQEIIIPALQPKLARGHSDMVYGLQTMRSFRVELVPDGNGALFCAKEFDNRTNTLKQVTILKRDDKGIATERIIAAQAEWDGEMSGWQLINGYSVRRNDPTSFTRVTQPDEIAFFASDLTPTTLRLRQSSKYKQLLSVRQLAGLLDKKLMFNTTPLKRIIYNRFSLPVINVLILAMMLPYYLCRMPGNLLVQSVKAAPLVLGAWAGGFIMMQIGPETLSPALTAWLPVIMYLPVTFFLMDRLET